MFRVLAILCLAKMQADEQLAMATAKKLVEQKRQIEKQCSK
ncbi:MULTISPECIES: hypothetical protein [Pseudomonadota]|jgi:hypothetical protein|uniref:Uncharacterized protein n=2 Tax=Gammaproteobacteria TaxID=1236 RepID=A0A7X0NKC0_9GAMM|nr:MULTISPECIES: hypothetical protein [Pseudomonadota]EJH37178.1 hypothetical protein VCCP104215_3810 [Vibrio cholerae CP1042(15)]EMQ31484.1 hypothetical protein VCEDC022_003825 [Vibrio cholerae O1 str. EDC-022]EMQ35403.1 hypothetical protein VCEM1536_003817 [Vibrio cholerae O1 str. EM-1536]EMQ36258.1 hypothetical protein VCEM1626_003822 [Vibrio cholerae O1 str. EM-1626]EWM34409.1 hypothetical protein VCPCS022_003836 [Vibrio cholerae O1 str. PCS-022]KKP08055.1 hypothetical protein VP96_03749 